MGKVLRKITGYFLAGLPAIGTFIAIGFLCEWWIAFVVIGGLAGAFALIALGVLGYKLIEDN